MSETIKILFITHKFYPNVGGTEANAEFLAQAFYENGAAVHLLTWTKESGAKNFPYVVIRNPSILTLLKQHLWANVIFENSPVIRLSWPALLTRKPFVASLNTWLTTEGQPPSLQAKVKMQWLKRAAKVIAVSNAIRRGSWPEATVIENSYNNKLFLNLKSDSERSKSFVFLGRLVSDKGADLAVKAISILVEKYAAMPEQLSKLNLTIIGDGADRALLERQIADLSLTNFISFTGSLSGQKLVDNLNMHKYMLIPSVWKEPFGIVALEGIGCGCIPIVSDGGGLPDAVGEAGLVFKRGSVDDLVTKMEMLLSDSTVENRLRLAAKHQLDMHAPSVVAAQYYNILLSVMNKKR